jgi:hypothetical protein
MVGVANRTLTKGFSGHTGHEIRSSLDIFRYAFLKRTLDVSSPVSW